VHEDNLNCTAFVDDPHFMHLGKDVMNVHVLKTAEDETRTLMWSVWWLLQMDKTVRGLEASLKTEMQTDEMCLLNGETASLYVSDVTTGSLTHGQFHFSCTELTVYIS